MAAAYALDYAQGDVVQPLIRNLGAILVAGAKPVDVIKQYMAKGDSPTRGRELNIHFGNPARDGSYEYYVSEPVVSNDYKGVGAFMLAATAWARGLPGAPLSAPCADG